VGFAGRSSILVGKRLRRALQERPTPGTGLRLLEAGDDLERAAAARAASQALSTSR
jgi:hypothetical protein